MADSVGAEDGLRLLGYLALSSLLRFAVMARAWRKSSAGRPRVVGRVSQITVYPVKAARGLDVEVAVATSAGLRLVDTTVDVRDRHWVITTSEYEALDLRHAPRIALITPTVADGCLQLTAPSMERISVPIQAQNHGPDVDVSIFRDNVPGVDCGKEVADWLERHLARPGVRLVHAGPHQARVVRSKYADKLGKTHGVAFSNSTALMVTSESSLADLNARLEEALPPLTFRANIVVTACPAYEEEKWTSEVHIGETGMSYVKLCQRCPATTVDLKSGVMRTNCEPLRTLRRYRPLMAEYNYQPVLGVQFKVTRAGIIRIGDDVYAST